MDGETKKLNLVSSCSLAYSAYRVLIYLIHQDLNTLHNKVFLNLRVGNKFGSGELEL